MLPKGCCIGEILEYEAKVTDDTRIEPFINRFVVTVGPSLEVKGGGGKRTKPPSDQDGSEREIPTSLAMPEIYKVHEADWDKHKFDKYSALKIVQEEAPASETSSDGGNAYHSFYVNMDNIYLKTELKATRQDPEILKARFMYGLILIGMALIQEYMKSEKVKTENESADQTASNEALTLDDYVFRTSIAIAPMLLPLIESLGALTEEQIAVDKQGGDDE
jgi:hypothetical protein